MSKSLVSLVYYLPSLVLLSEKPPIRFWIGTMVFMTTFTNYMYRANISVSIVSMSHKAGSNETPPCLKEREKKGEPKKKKPAEHYGPTYDWDEAKQGYILSAYFWGFLTTSLPGGIIAETVGPWHAILWSSLAAMVLNSLTPTAASLHFGAVIAIRLLIGMLGGLGYPAVNVLIARWAPPDEKGRFLGAMMGNTLGTVVTWNLIGVVTKASENWHWGFYVLDILQFCFCVTFAIVASSSPTKHRWISEEEKNYILEKQAGTVTTTKAIPPYKQIFLSCKFWATIAAQFGNLWGLNLILTYAPKFMSQTLGFDIRSSGSLAALPYLARLICSQIFGYVGDKMRIKGVMGVTKLRKFFIIFSHFIPAAFLLLIMTVGCNYYGVIPFLVLNQAFNGAVVVSHLVNPQDLSPNFAGTLYGIMNFVAGMSGFIVPQISAAFSKAYSRGIKGSIWIFTIGAIMFSVGGTLFILFGSAEVQPWNEKKGDKKEEQPQTAT